MRIYIAASLLGIFFSSASFAQSPLPTTVVLPMSLVTAIRGHLGKEPYEGVAPMISALENCAGMQIPTNGMIVDRGACPDVSAYQKTTEDSKNKSAVDAVEKYKSEHPEAAPK